MGLAGIVVGTISDGVLCKMILFLMYLITLLCNLLGYLWLYLASQARTPDNSSEGAVNYCAPEIWYTAKLVVNLFWIFSAIGALMVCAQIHRFFRTEEARRQPVILGSPPADWKEGKKKLLNV